MPIKEATSEEVVLNVTFFSLLCFHFGILRTGTANAVQLCSSGGLDAERRASSTMWKNQQPLVLCCECVLTLFVQCDSEDLTATVELAGFFFVRVCLRVFMPLHMHQPVHQEMMETTSSRGFGFTRLLNKTD